MVVLLLDAYNLLFRAFTSLPASITTRDDRPINAVYGMLSYVSRLAGDYRPSAIVAAFDTPVVPTFRRELFPNYQAQRGPMGGEFAADFSRQVDIAIRVLPSLRVSAVSIPRFEADDIMATMASSLSQRGCTCVIVSTDRDLLQVVSESISVLAPGNPPRFASSYQDVHERLGVDPSGVATFKALAGDASDNIPGVRGIGTKTACSLIAQFGSLEAIYSQIEALSPRMQALLLNGRSDVFLYRDIATVRTDIPLPLDVDSLPDPVELTGVKPRQLLRLAGVE